MDKEIPKSELGVKPPRAIIRLTKTQLASPTPFYRGTLPLRRTLSVEDIADRAKEHRSPYSRELLIAAYRTMNNEVYDAIEHGFNVDLGLARTELIVKGRFNSEYDKFDPDRHALEIRFRPSPRLKQVAASIPGDCQPGLFASGPGINEISIYREPHSGNDPSRLPFNTLPTGYDSPVFLYGRRLRLMGDHPDVGVTLRCLTTGEEARIPLNRMFINELNRLCFQPPLPLTPGEWEVDVSTQFTPTYHLYKEPRMDRLTLTVLDSASLE